MTRNTENVYPIIYPREKETTTLITIWQEVGKLRHAGRMWPARTFHAAQRHLQKLLSLIVSIK